MSDPRRENILNKYPGAARKRQVAQEQPASSSGTGIKLTIAIVVMLVAGIGAVFLVKHLSGGKAAASGPLLGDDKTVVTSIDDYGVQDLEEWLKVYEGRMVMGQTRNQSLDMYKRFKDMGAKNVWAFKGSTMTMSVVVELPDEAEKRAPIFNWYKDRFLNHNNEAKGDVGQKYLLLYMTP